jgi:hypothetical protein
LGRPTQAENLPSPSVEIISPKTGQGNDDRGCCLPAGRFGETASGTSIGFSLIYLSMVKRIHKPIHLTNGGMVTHENRATSSGQEDPLVLDLNHKSEVTVSAYFHHSDHRLHSGRPP